MLHIMIMGLQAACISVAIAQALIPIQTIIWDTGIIISFPMDYIWLDDIVTEDMNHQDFQAGLLHTVLCLQVPGAVLADPEFEWEVET